MKKLILILTTLITFSAPFMGYAQTIRYVSDKLEITMRNGQGVKYGIKRMLESGTKLEVLETDPAGYSRVKTMSGVEGWVLTRYLSNQGSASDLLAASQQKVANLELELAKNKEEMQSLLNQYSISGNENSTLKETAQRLKKELENLKRTASNAVALDNENRQLKQNLQEIDHKMQAISVENNNLKDNNNKSWFLIGAAVLFGGIILGLILPKLRFSKKDAWNSF